MTMRELTKSALALPWAMSMFGVQQMANLMSKPSSGGMEGSARAFDAVADASAQHLDGWIKQTYKFGGTVQGTLVDLMMLRTPEFDQSALMHMAAEMKDGKAFDAIVHYGLPPVGWLSSFFVARRDAPATLQEFNNKLQIILLVTHALGELGLKDNSTDSLQSLADKIEAAPTFPRVWTTEGVGNWFGDVAVAKAAGGPDPTGLLTDPTLASLPLWTLTILHAGIGMAFAKAILVTLEPTSSPELIRAGIARFVRLCHESSRPGYAGAALESLGLATRTLYPGLLLPIDREIPAVDSDLHGYYWHGAGRAMYFEPGGMLPSVNAPWRVIRRLDQEAPHDLARRNIIAGVAWALTVVNMRHPIVMETFLRHHADLATHDDAFVNGVTSALLMRYDTTRESSWIRPFMHHRPAADSGQADVWRTVITDPCEHALANTYGELVGSQSLEQVFHYRPSR